MVKPRPSHFNAWLVLKIWRAVIYYVHSWDHPLGGWVGSTPADTLKKIIFTIFGFHALSFFLGGDSTVDDRSTGVGPHPLKWHMVVVGAGGVMAIDLLMCYGG